MRAGVHETPLMLVITSDTAAGNQFVTRYPVDFALLTGFHGAIRDALMLQPVGTVITATDADGSVSYRLER